MMLDSNTTLPKTYVELLISCWHISEHKQEAFLFMHTMHSRTFSMLWGLLYSSPRLIFVKSSRRNSPEISGRKVDSTVSVMGLDSRRSAKWLARDIAARGETMVHLWCALSLWHSTLLPLCLCLSVCLPPQCLFMIHLSLTEDLFNIKAYQRTFYWHSAFPQLMFGCFGSLNVTKCMYRDILSWLSVCVCVCVCAWWEIDIWRSVYSLRIKDAPSVREIEKNKAPLDAWQLH